MKVTFDIASDQIDGARDYQEDSFLVNQLGESSDGHPCSLIIMADGMGGHAAGNVASNLAVAAFNKTFQSKFPLSDAPAVLAHALNKSNDQIHAAVRETDALRGMGCTMVAAYIEGTRLYWASVGDSHLYVVRDRELIKQNADHSYGAYLDMMKDQGMEVEGQDGMSRNMLMSAMTGDEISSIDVSEEAVELFPGDRIIIASDGLDTIGAGAIIQYSSWSGNAKECAYTLLKAVEDAGKINQDNTTLIVVDIKEQVDVESTETVRLDETLPQIEEQPLAKIDEVNEGKSKKTKKQKVNKRKWKRVDADYMHSSFSVWINRLIVFSLLGTGAFYAWEQRIFDGMFDGAMDKGSDLVKQTQKTLQKTQKSIESGINSISKDKLERQVQTDPAPKPRATSKPRPRVISNAKLFSDRLSSGGRGPAMIQVPRGVFEMGGSAASISNNDVPKHKVSVKSFMISAFEITFAEYNRFAEATRRASPKNGEWDPKTHPVVSVSWDNALAYTRWLSTQSGKNYRLLSEAEWEYAARAGSRTFYWWGAKIGSGKAHCFDCRTDFNTSKPAKVGTYRPNPFGIYDTAGNVSEWVHDCYHRNYNNAPTDGLVWEGGDCESRVVRGGAFRSPANSMRSSNREKFRSGKGQYNVGIRVARDL